MSTNRLTTAFAVLFALGASSFSVCGSPQASAQQPQQQPVQFRVSGATQRLEMIVQTSRILTFDHKVPNLLIQNPDIIQATPLSPNQVQLNALRQGVTSLNVWNEDNEVRSIDIHVFGDVRQLDQVLERLFPDANVRAETLGSSLRLAGHAPSAEHVNRIVEVSREYFPKVINHMTVGGVQTIALHVKVVEVSRTKLRRLGVDWSLLTGNDFIIQSAAGIGATGDTLRFGIVNGGTSFTALIDALRQNSMAKLLAEPTLVAISGRPASFNSGGQIPIPVSGGLGVTTVEYREFGTTVDFVPTVLENGRIHLEVRPEVTEVDGSLRDPVTGTPGMRQRRVDTAVEMMPGQTLALAGLIQNRTESENVGIPWLADIPWFGVPFRKVRDQTNEIELLILVTPEIVAPMDPHEVPRCLPGQSTTSPNDVELYYRGHLEVPRCCFDGSCPQCQGYGEGMFGPSGPVESYEIIPRDSSGGPERGGASPRLEVPRGADPQSSVPRRHNSPRLAQPQPTRTEPTPAYNSYNGYNQQSRGSESYNIRIVDEPAIIGPVGYDVSN